MKDTPTSKMQQVENTPLNDRSVSSQPRRDKRSRYAFNMLAALLVVGIIIGASALLFTRLMPHYAAGSGSNLAGKKVTVVSQAGGLEMSMSVTAGPYFLSEMLAVDISLTNHNQTTSYVGLPFAPDPCGYWSGVEVTGGGAPTYEIRISTDHSCPLISNNTPLNPGQTLTVHKYLPLTKSGIQILTAKTEFYSSGRQETHPFPSTIVSPLEKHWPTLQVNVSPTVPSDRTLSFRIAGSQVTAITPSSVPSSSLVYLYGVMCEDANNDGGRTITGNYGWEPLSKNTVNKPGCPGKNVQWTFAFGVPGYAIVIGNDPQKS